MADLSERIERYAQVKPMGKPSSPVWFLGRCPHHQDLKSGTAFQNGGARLLVGVAKDAGLRTTDCFRTNLINRHPPFENFKQFLVKKKFLQEKGCSPREMELLGPIGKTDYLHPCFLPDLQELLGLIRIHQPNLIVGLGSEVSSWLTGSTSIDASRGFINECRLVKGQKVLNTYSPMAVLANWAHRPVMVADLIKAKDEGSFAGIKRISRKIYLPESVDDVIWFVKKLRPEDEISVDIETYPHLRLIRSVGISFSEREALTIPFVDLAKPSGSYWDSADDEMSVWRVLKNLLQNSNAKIGQNFSYDCDWLYREMGIKSINYNWDTMIMHHAQYPEMKKSLGFMASLYTNEMEWKNMVSHKAGEKKDG